MLVAVPVSYMKRVSFPYIPWKDSFSVGVEEIDHDHKKLLELLNRVAFSSSLNLGEEYVREIIGKLISYTRYHLEREEKLMQQDQYPEIEQHLLQHKKFIEKINAFEKGFQEDKIKYHQIFDFLKCWLPKHISRTDKELGAYIQARRA